MGWAQWHHYNGLSSCTMGNKYRVMDKEAEEGGLMKIVVTFICKYPEFKICICVRNISVHKNRTCHIFGIGCYCIPFILFLVSCNQ